MPKAHLTKAIVDKLAPGAKDTVYWDTGLAGFGIKVTPKGRRVFIVLYRTRDGRGSLRKYTIGPYGQTRYLPPGSMAGIRRGKSVGRDISMSKTQSTTSSLTTSRGMLIASAQRLAFARY